jgi:sugar-specific transcriptional regulator TrmB
LSLERVIKALIDLGLSRADAKVYVYLAKKGPSEIVNLSDAFKFSKQKLSRSLKNLQSKGIVSVNLKGNALVSALPFEQTLELLITIKEEQTHIMQESKEGLLSSWRKMTKEGPEKS